MKNKLYLCSENQEHFGITAHISTHFHWCISNSLTRYQ